MGTMRSNFTEAFVLFILMLSTSHSLPWTGQNSLRNSLVDTSTEDIRSWSPSTDARSKDCVFIDPKMPICDEEWMMNYRDEEDPIEVKAPRLRKRAAGLSLDGPSEIYAFRGCRPERIPFSLPKCTFLHVYRNLRNGPNDIQVITPFFVPGVDTAPYEFPKFNYPRWSRMMHRFLDHVSSKKNSSVNGSTWGLSTEVPQGSPSESNPATSKETIPNAMAVGTSISNRSSSSTKLILRGQREAAESLNKGKGIVSSEVERMGQNESRASSGSLGLGNTSDVQRAESRRRGKTVAHGKKYSGHSRKALDKDAVSSKGEKKEEKTKEK